MWSKKELENAIKAAEKPTMETVHSDGYGEGALMVRIIPGKRGKSATWIASLMRDGQQKRDAIGKYPAMQPAEALAVLRELVVESKKQARGDTSGGTVAELFVGYLDNLQTRDARSLLEVRRLLLTGSNAAVNALGSHKQASEVTPGDVALFLQNINDDGKRRSAAAMRTALNAAFNWAIGSRFDYRDKNGRDWGITENPVAVVKKDNNSSQARTRNLTASEILKVYSYSGKQAPGLDVLRLVILTGQRVLETLRIAAEDIDWEERIWNMPAEKTKGGFKAHAVPLCDRAVELLARLNHNAAGMGYLFPAARGDGHLSTDSVQKAARMIDTVEPFQPRDLRRTWKSRAGDAGIERDIRDRLQQHLITDTGTKFYDHYDYLPEKREAVRKWGEWLEKNVFL